MFDFITQDQNITHLIMSTTANFHVINKEMILAAV